MSQPLRTSWTLADFLSWADDQNERYEFDGSRPIAMTGGTVGHGYVQRKLLVALDRRLPGKPCQPHGPDVAIRTTGDAIRYPDALVSRAVLDPRALTVPDPVVVFEVLSPNSQRTDRFLKVREYAAVPSIRRYVMIESTSVGLTVLERATSGAPWQASILIGVEDVLDLPEIGITVPVAELYEGLSFD